MTNKRLIQAGLRLWRPGRGPLDLCGQQRQSRQSTGTGGLHQPAPHAGAAVPQEAQAGTFWSYVAGTAYKVMTEHEVGGLFIDNHTTTLPLKKGLSSSAAVCVLARARRRRAPRPLPA